MLTVSDLHSIALATGEGADKVLARLLIESFEAGVHAVKSGKERFMLARLGMVTGFLRDAQIVDTLPEVPSLVLSGPAAMETQADA
jgi:hypothetical protein